MRVPGVFTHPPHLFPLKVFIYASSSTRDPQSLTKQLHLTRSYAQMRGWVVIGEFEESICESIEGEGKAQLFAALAEKAADALLVTRLDTISTKLTELDWVLRELRKRKIALVSLAENLDSTQKLGAIFFHILLRVLNACVNAKSIWGRQGASVRKKLTPNDHDFLKRLIAISEHPRYSGCRFLAGIVVLIFIDIQADPWWLSLLFAGIVFWALWPGFPLLWSLLHRRPIVALWLRRFHRGEGAKDICQFLEQAFAVWGQVVTLSDDDISESPGRVRGAKALRYLAPIGYIGSFVLIGRGLWKDEHLSRLSPTQQHGIVAVWIGMAIGPVVAFFYLQRFVRKQLIPGLAITRAIDTDSLEHVLRRVRLIKMDKARLFGPSTVFRCPSQDDDVWRQVVSRLVPECDLILLDASQFSESLEWELRLVHSFCPMSKLVLLVSETSTGLKFPWGEKVEFVLGQLYGKARPPVLIYPTRFPWYAGVSRASSAQVNALKIIGSLL